MIGQNSHKGLYLLVFTDLDGTLLEQETYSFEHAIPAVRALEEKKIPLIFCTSKTRAEIEEIQCQLNNSHPFISENGGAIFIPKGYFSHAFHFTREDTNHLIIELGTPYIKLREVFNQMCVRLPGKLRGFGDMTANEVSDLCGFSISHARLAKKREYDEPFLLKDETAEGLLQDMASRSNLKITRGGRFYHLIGSNDKGKAVLLLKDIYKQQSEHIKTVALGDSLNDLPMLEVVDYPILVKKPDGSYDPSIQLDNLILAPESGPKGWCQAMLHLFDQLD